jgi:SAM-dependent methyltransferase
MTGNVENRTPYQGLMQIFHYNQPFYARTLGAVAVAVVFSVWLPSALRALLLLVCGIAVFWTCSSLLVSHYVYDRSALYSLSWLNGLLSRPPARWINIHAGLDETSGIIASLFPGSTGQTIDIYDPQEMTEPSIGHARHITQAASPIADWRALPAADHYFDTVFLIFAAHELRHQEARVKFLQEVERVLRPTGEVVMVEHLRDWSNFAAFGPGFLHFFSGSAWRHAAEAAHLSIRRRRTITPFVHVFVLRRSL